MLSLHPPYFHSAIAPFTVFQRNETAGCILVFLIEMSVPAATDGICVIVSVLRVHPFAPLKSNELKNSQRNGYYV